MSHSDFFVAGGTLRPDSPSYVVRPADERLFQLALTNTLCYVLTTRQMGKSSLMNRVGQQLRQQNIQIAMIDLTGIGTVSLDEWYVSLLDDLQTQLSLTTDAEAYWFDRQNLSPVRRFNKYLLEVVLNEISGSIVIFIDEIDAALTLPFSDDFFATIRSITNQSAHGDRLSFVLLGVAAPNDLIKGAQRTPFNVGERIELEELALADARAVFAAALPDSTVVDRVFHWTNGHPYLTQRIGQAIVRSGQESWSEQAIDELVTQLFLTEQAQREDSNLQFINGRITTTPQKEKLLHLYKQIQSGKKIKNDEQVELQTELKLYGLVKPDAHGNLIVRNRIYEHVFDKQWRKQQTTSHWRRNLIGLLLLITIISVGLNLYFGQQAQQADDLLAQTYIDTFSTTENTTLRLDNLSRLLTLPNYEQQGVELFNSLPPAEQVALFADYSPDLQAQMEIVIVKIYYSFGNDDVTKQPENSQLLAAMLAALRQSTTLQNPTLPAEIESWVQGRTAVLRGNHEQARLSYSVALSLNEQNPATRFERMQVALLLQDDEDVLSDLQELLLFGDEWPLRLQQFVSDNAQLHPLILNNSATFNELVAFVPTSIPIALPLAVDAISLSSTPTSFVPTLTAVVRAEATEMASSEPVETAVSITNAPLSVPQTDPAGTIVYTCFVDNIDQICTIQADGTGQRQLTMGDSTNWYPSFAHDQQTILFSSLRTGLFSLHQLDLATENGEQLLETQAGDYSPAVSLDGSQILFTRAQNGRQNVWLMNRDGSGAYPLTDVVGDALDPIWSPDGMQIVFARRLDGEEWYTHLIMNVDGSNTRLLSLPLSHVGGRSDWSLNGRWLAIYAGLPGDHDIYLVATDGSEVRRLTFGGDNLAPSFSPDGNWIVFTSARDGDNELYIMRLDGTGLKQLTFNEMSDWQPRWGQ